MADAGSGRPRVDRPEPATAPDLPGLPRRTLRTLRAILDGPLGGLFRGVHVLPPFPSSAIEGSRRTYAQIDPRFGSWVDIEELASTHDVLLDVMVNHISRHSPEFQAFEHEGRRHRPLISSSRPTRSGRTGSRPLTTLPAFPAPEYRPVFDVHDRRRGAGDRLDDLRGR